MKKIFKTVIFILIAAYAVNAFFSNQRMLNSYARERDEYQEELAAAKEEQAELQNTVDNMNTTEFIEKVARERLDMYLPNERVYIDIEK